MESTVAKKNRDLGVTTQFDYFVLSSEQRAIVQQRTGEIRERLQRSAQDIWEIGQRLADVRAALKHGQFEAWLKAEFGWSRRTAYNFINVYETFQERANLAQIDIATSALYLLAAPSTPADVREASLQEAKQGKKITYKELRDRIEQERSQAEELTATTVQTIPKPEIVTLIPGTASEAPVDIADAVESPVNLNQALRPGWYLVDRQHLVFCGDTATPEFYAMLPEVVFALAASPDEWDHDWLIEAARFVTVLPEAELQDAMIEQLITLFSRRKDTVVFPWLPHPQMLAIAHRLGRKIVAGDLSPHRCRQAIQATGLSVTRIEL
ncbi:MAG: DUF3102 domain-containing protein [Synechococcales cyanobacterium M58_A2018_015]|nr:DUF3102 domain-containing protein [Synechococcales cyanobacterium M58_A2018_015]